MAAANEGKLRGEVLRAVSRKRKPSAELVWLFSQCSKSTSTLFRLYDEQGVVPTWDRQTFRQWKYLVGFQRITHPRGARRRTIIIQPLTHKSFSSGYAMTEINTTVMKHLQHFCQAFFFNTTVEIADPIDLAQIRNLTSRVHKTTNREQFLVGDILRHFKTHRPRDAHVVGITTADLYPCEEENFVLGHASLTSGCGVFSFGRYFNSQVAAGHGGGRGSDFNYQLQNLWVLMRVMTHELCHTFGMKHCYYFECAMNESSSIEQAARQPLFLCPVCLRKLHKALRFNILERFRMLAIQCQKLNQVVKDCSESIIRQRCEEDPQQGLEVEADGAVSMAGGDVTEHLQYFRQATEWLENSIASLSQFAE